MIKRILATLILALAVTTVYAQSPSCSTPGAGYLFNVVGHLSTKWNCWLQDSVYGYYKLRGFSDQLATDYAGWALNQDTANRFDEAMTQLRNANPQYFDQVMVTHGLVFNGQ
jgi:hypothetical protein